MLNRLCFFVLLLIGVLSKATAQQYIGLNVDNDLYFGIDRYYSSGIFLEYGKQRELLNDSLYRYNWVSRHWTLGQEINTPALRLIEDKSRMDYPYNGWLFIGFEENRFKTPDFGYGWGMQVGTTGANASLAKFFQNTYHIYILNLEPLSWATAQPQAFHLNAKALLFWGKALSSKVKWVGRHQLQTGSFRTTAQSRVGLQLGSLPGLPFFGNRLEAIQNGLSFFLGSMLEYSLHDYSLSGSLIRQNSPFTLEAVSLRSHYQVGFIGFYQPWRIQLLLNNSSPYMTTQKYRRHPFLNITLSYLF